MDGAGHPVQIGETMENTGLLTYAPGTVVDGVYKSYGTRFGFLITDKEHEDIYIAEKDRMTAVNNDHVVVKVIRGTTGRHNVEGRIINITERANETVVGTYELFSDGGEVVPVDEKIHMVIDIPEGEDMQAVTGAKVIVKITRWPGQWANAEGRVTEIIGYEGDKGVDIDVIVAQHHLPHVFKKELMEEADGLPHAVQVEKETADFRDIPMVTIDGADSKDLDDAVYCERKENGHFRLGVYIADVSRYVRRGMLLDEEAYRRGNSAYLADRVIPMLPFQLSNDLCSLNAGEDRYAMACVMDVSPEGKVITEQITPAVIHVGRRCNYEEINKAFEEGIAPDDLKPFLGMLEALRDCAGALRSDRKERGAIEFEFPEYKVVLDEEGKPLRIVKRLRGESEKMIEDAMIAANEAVARFLRDSGHTAVYRVHANPDPDRVEALKKLTRILGTRVQLPEEPKPKDIQRLLESVKGTDVAAVVEVMSLRSLPQACYSTENEGHFGIASECYTHFTSPIRRYPDLMVHRLIRQALFEKPGEGALKKQTAFLEKASAHCSETEQAAVETERDVTDLKMTEYMEPFVGEPFDGTITGVTRFGIFAELENGVEGLARLDMMDEEFVYNEDTMTLKGALSGTVYSLGMPVRVTLIRADKEKREVDFVIGEIRSPLELERKRSGSGQRTGGKKGKPRLSLGLEKGTRKKSHGKKGKKGR